MSQRAKNAWWPEELGGSWVQRVVPAFIVFTQVGQGQTRLVPLAPAEALKRSIRWSPWVFQEPPFAGEHLELLQRLVTQAQCFLGTLGPDLFSAPNVLLDYLP